jgi:DNA-binding response OmpR family regulator
MSSKKTIFIVEDDPSIHFGLREVFGTEGFDVDGCEDGGQAVARIVETRPDLVILDVMLPGKNGFEICKELRASKCVVPVLMLTSKGQELDKVIGLDAGADDYVTKPFGVRELVARVNALLRRASGGEGGEATATAATFQIGEAEVSRRTFEITVDGRSERLTPKEMGLLAFFDGHRGEVLSRDEILDAVWGMNYYGTTRTLDQCVAQLRKKMGDSGSKPLHLQTVHGVGYKLADS